MEMARHRGDWTFYILAGNDKQGQDEIVHR